MTWLRETPYSLCYYTLLERVRQIQGNDLGYSKNAKDWAIRRRVPKAAKSNSLSCDKSNSLSCDKSNSLSCEIGHGTVSETAKALVFNDDLINLRMLKVQSILHRNMKCNHHRGGLSYSN